MTHKTGIGWTRLEKNRGRSSELEKKGIPRWEKSNGRFLNALGEMGILKRGGGKQKKTAGWKTRTGEKKECGRGPTQGEGDNSKKEGKTDEDRTPAKHRTRKLRNRVPQGKPRAPH